MALDLTQYWPQKIFAWISDQSFQVLEEDVVESHKNLVDSMEHWIQQDASLLAMTNEVDYDQDGESQYISSKASIMETPSLNVLFHISVDFNFVSTAYAQQLEDMIAEKQEQLATLRDKTRAFRFDL